MWKMLKQKLLKTSVLFVVGGFLYSCVEILWRGYTHWTMFFLGGLCFILIGHINEHLNWNMHLWKQSLIGSFTITILEFFTGAVVNLWLDWNIWDYSNLPYNILGQVCLFFFILWIPVSIVAIIIDDYLRYWIFKEEKPVYKIF